MPSSSKKCNIAIAEDEPSLCNLYSIVLKKNSLDVVFIGKSGEEILAAIGRGELSKDNLDTILLDYRLRSGIDGLVTARRIREVIRTAKIIMVSADYSVRAQVFKAGFSFIGKPFSINELLKVVLEYGSNNSDEKKRLISAESIV